MLKECFRRLAFVVYRLLPKFNHAVVYGWPDYEDTALALQERLNETSVRKVIFFIYGNGCHQFQLKPKTKIIRKDSVHGLWYFLFAKYIFFTHRCFMWRFPSNVISVNVWHGMPIKTIGWMQKDHRGIASRFALATSEFWADIMQQAMTPYERTLVTGLPRTDRMFSSPDLVWSRLGFSSGCPFKKTVAWLPTYRNSVRGEIFRDGKDSGNIFGMPGITAETLNEFFKQQNAFAFVKPHPMAPFEKAIELSNLIVIDDQWFRDRGLTLYEVLGQMDALVTDISSVVVDYLILDRPVIHSFPDLSEYESSRGFSIQPVTDYLVGPVAMDAGELLHYLSKVLQGDDSHANQRRRIRKLFHKNADGDSTNRLLRHLELLPK
jgi:CDP-glycerol glycerophosphotransferase (TagB/SpsB family)